MLPGYHGRGTPPDPVRPPPVAATDSLRSYLFAWFDTRVCPDHQLTVIARDDDTTFGILHSRFHELWSLRLCTWQGKGNDPRYTLEMASRKGTPVAT